ncbi:hypothetical protein [Pseudomonas sp. RA_35y_Pfl2_P32]|uniref:hypothetical protein n=1 Tax=Pseudomonas sp. RA_35y_Pfl2_P32 TaxID=3088705 RepID=UPI0030D7382C
MKEEVEIAQAITALIAKTPIGQTVSVELLGKPTVGFVTFEFAGGWIFEQKLIPGMSLEFIRGEDHYLKAITVSLHPFDGLK